MKRLPFSAAFAVLIGTLMSAISCTQSNIDVTDPYAYDDGSSVSHDLIVLGDRLEDPYTVANMTKAVSELYPTKASVIELVPTDHYIRILPSDESQLKTLDSLGVQMLDHPLDYEIVREGDYYHDPEIPEGGITWQYAVVPADFKMPDGIRYEIVDKCYIPSGDTKAVSASGDDLSWVDWDAVEERAFDITGNSALYEPSTRGSAKSRYPKGRISIMDKDYSSNPIGVKCVKVTCNVFVKFARVYTDEEGYYQMNRSFSSKPRYRIEFTNRKGFSLGYNWVLVKGSVSTLGKHGPEGYSICINESSNDNLFKRSVINNAAFDYYEGCTQRGASIPTPPKNLRIWMMGAMESSSAPMLQQGPVLDMDGVKQLLGDSAAIVIPVIRMFLPDIVVGLKNKNSYPEIYRTVVHELAHASHYMRVRNEYWDTLIKFMVSSYLSSGGVAYGAGTEDDAGYCDVTETWAYYVENALSRERYGDTEQVFGTSWRFRPQILLYLDDRGLNRFKIMQALSAEVHEMSSLKSRLISIFPEFKSTINEAFNKYL